MGNQSSGQIPAEKTENRGGSCVSLSCFPSEDPEVGIQFEALPVTYSRGSKKKSFGILNSLAILGFGDRETSFEKINRLPTGDLKNLSLDKELQDFIFLNREEDAAIISKLTVARMMTENVTHHRPKASRGWYLFFLILLCGSFCSGLLLLVYVFNENVHHIFYISIFFGIALMSLLLDWFDQLLPFIRRWENLWNVQRLNIRVNLDWPVGDSKSDRKSRMLAAAIILKQARKYLKWDGCCRFLRFGVRSRIVDKNIVISATLSDKKRKESMDRLKNITEFIKNLNEQENELESHKCRINSVNVDTNVTFDRLAPQLFFGLFFIISLVDYILLRITSQYAVPLPLYVSAEWILYYTAIMLMIMAIFCNWTKISFACSEKAWVQGLLNVSIVGFFVLVIARKLRPPTEIEIDEDTGRLKVKERKISDITWHNYHHWNKQIDGIVFTAVISWMLVFFFVVSVSAFAEFANKAEQWGRPFAWVCFLSMAMLIMLTPAGIIIDVFGGYFIISIIEFSTWRGWRRALLSAIIGIVFLHYIGSCFQYLIGKQPFAQHWMNRTFAIEMLASSDAVLGDANWFKVGLVGFTIPAIGFNLGRMQTEFWTQFWSEWHTWPTCFCLVMFGGILALNRKVCNDEVVIDHCLDLVSPWTTQAIPMLLVMPILMKILGSSIGANILACARHTDKYIMAREKWHIVHTLMKVGFVPTKMGWKEDVYELAWSRDGGLSYFEKACHLQHQWLEIEKSCNADTLAEKLEEFKWHKWIPLRYQDHIKYLLKKVRFMEEKEQDKFEKHFKKTVEEDLFQKAGMWEDVYKNKWKKIFQSILVIILVVCFYFCVFGFYLALDLEELSSQGLGFLSKIEVYYWISAGLFFICSCIYYWDALKKTLLGTFAGLLHFIQCCHVNAEMETTFLTPTKPSSVAL